MRYRIEVKSIAQKELRNLPQDIARRVAKAIDALALDPRPRGSEKLAGHESIYRTRVGDYRILYEVRDELILILVLRVRHRRDVYRKDL